MKKQFLLDGKIILTVTKCKRPSFKNHRGRTWDAGKIKIDGIEYEAHLDTSWGDYIYFQYGEKFDWYKVRMYSDATKAGPEYNIYPFSIQPHIITTK